LEQTTRLTRITSLSNHKRQHTEMTTMLIGAQPCAHDI